MSIWRRLPAALGLAGAVCVLVDIDIDLFVLRILGLVLVLSAVAILVSGSLETYRQRRSRMISCPICSDPVRGDRGPMDLIEHIATGHDIPTAVHVRTICLGPHPYKSKPQPDKQWTEDQLP